MHQLLRPALLLIAGLSLPLALMVGCATERAAQSKADEAPISPFVRHIAPFEVLDAEGIPYEYPFLGGLNVPRPQFIDIDADGDLDLFVQENTGEVMFFENDGSSLLWRTDHYQHLNVGEWYRFVDLDEDGDVDLLAEQRFSYIQYFRNEGTPQNAAFAVAADTLKAVDGTPLFSDRQNIPNLTDIDCDRRLDLFIGRVEGTVMRYELAAADGEGLPRFQLVTNRFEDIEIIGQIGSLHGANTISFADADQDGDQDLFWGDFFEPGLLFIENTGTCTSPSLRGSPVPYPKGDPLSTSGYNASALIDWDADDDLDLFVTVLGGAFNPNLTAAANFYYLERTSEEAFILRTRQFLSMIDVGSESIPSLADLDGDGDLDLLLANKIDPDDVERAHLYFFANVGTPTAPSFQRQDALDLAPSFHYAPAPGDLDADGDLDLLVGTWNTGIALYRNVGTQEAPQFELEDDAYVTLTRGSNSTPALVDIDGDGDLDLFVGETSGAINFYRNEGSPQAPTFVLVSDTFEDIDVGRRSFPAFSDLDDDGDQDLIVGTDASGLILYRNEGTPQAPLFAPDSSFTLDVPGFATPTFGDLDGDGDEDLISGGVGGGLVYYERRGNR